MPLGASAKINIERMVKAWPIGFDVQRYILNMIKYMEIFNET